MPALNFSFIIFIKKKLLTFDYNQYSGKCCNDDTFKYYNNMIVSIFYPFSKIPGPFAQYKAKKIHFPLKFCFNSSGLEWRWNIPVQGTSIITSCPSQGICGGSTSFLSLCPTALPVIWGHRATRIPPTSCRTHVERSLSCTYIPTGNYNGDKVPRNRLEF